MNSFKSFAAKLPSCADFQAVLGVSLFVCHGWSLRGFFDELPSFLLYFQVSDLYGIFSYMMAFALLESLLIAGGLALLAVILPSKSLRDGFSYKGLTAIVISALAALDLQKRLGIVYPPRDVLLLEFLVPLAIIIVLIVLVSKIVRIQRILNDLSDRFTIMVYVFVPLGLVSLGVVIYRNIF